MLDAYGNVATFGKQTGTDITDNKKTILYLTALEKGSEEQRQRLRKLFFETPSNPSKKIQEVLRIYAELDIKKEIEESISDMHTKAEKALLAINRPEKDKAALRQIAAKLLDRKV